jgi:hypothetical protein
MRIREYARQVRSFLLPAAGVTRRRGRRRYQAEFERLEDRTLLSTIKWVNRGSSTPANDSDKFNQVFGANADTARAVVDAAIRSWQNVIVNFNQSGGGNELDLTISMDPSDKGNGGSATSGTSTDGHGRPTAGSIDVGSGSDGKGAGWYLDPTPNDSSEFQGSIVNAFAGDAQAGSPAARLSDLFTVMALEMTHTLGLNRDPNELFQQDPNHYLTNTTKADAAVSAGKGTLFTFNGPDAQALFTTNNGGSGGKDTGKALHTAEPTPGNTVTAGGVTYYGVQDSDNAVYENSRRYLPSYLDALILRDVYGYTITPPQTFGTFYASLNTTTGNLLIRGGDAGESIYGPTTPSDDTFALVQSGTNLMVSVNIGTPVPGTGPVGPLVSTFPLSGVKSITIQGMDGNDTATLDFSGGNFIPSGGITYDGGSTTEDNALVFKRGNFTNEVLNATGAGAGKITLDGTGQIRFTNLQQVDDTTTATNYTLIATDNSEQINVVDALHQVDGLQATQINSGASATFALVNIANKRNVTVNGRGGSDSFSLNNPNPGIGLNTLTLTGGDGGNSFSVQATAVATVINAGRGNDTINLRNADNSMAGILGALTVNGPGGTARTTLNASNDDDFTLTDTALTSVGSGITVALNKIDIANLAGGPSANRFDVSGWHGSGTLDGETNTVGIDTVVASNSSNFTLTDNSLARGGGFGTLSLEHIGAANLTDTGTGHTFDVGGWTGTGNLTADPSHTDTLAATKDVAGFTLTNASLTSTDGMSLALVGQNFTTAHLTGGPSPNTFDVSGWTGSATLTGAGGNDTVTATKAAGFTLTDSTLNAGDGMTLALTPGTIRAATLTETGGGHRFTLNTAADSWTGSGTLTGTGGNDTVTVAKNAGFVLGNGALNVTQSPTDHMALGLAGIGTAELTDLGGKHSFAVSDWTGSGSLTGPADLSDTVTAQKDADFTLADNLLQTSDGMKLNLARLGVANLAGGPSPNKFDVGGWTGTGSLDGQGGDDTVTASGNANFTLTNTSLDRTGAGTLSLASIETAVLTETGGTHAFDVGGWTGHGTLTGDAGRTDVVQAVKDAARVVLTNANLGASDGMSLNLANLANAKLTGGPSPNDFDVSNWTGTGTLTGANHNDTVTATKAASFTLSDTALNTSDLMRLNLTGIDTADLSETGGGHVFTVDQWSGGGSLTGTGGNDTVAKSRDVSFTLGDSDLHATDGMDMALAGIRTANLTGGSSANTFDVGGWTGNGSLTGGGGKDTVVAAKDKDFTLSNTALKTTDGMSLKLAAIGTADLSGGPGPNTFDVGGWTGDGKLDGQGGTDTVRATKDANFTLTDSRLVTTDGMSLALERLAVANLTGGAGDNLFDVSGWTGTGMLDGGSGGTDTVVATRDTDFGLTDTSLADSAGMALGLAHIEAATLTGGAGPNHFTVGNWTGNAVLDGLDGPDTYTVNFRGSGSGTTTIHDTGATGTDRLVVVGTPGGDNITVTENQVTRGAETVNYQGIEQEAVYGGGGTNTISVRVTPTSGYNLTVDAGPSAGNTLNVTDVVGGAVAHNHPTTQTSGGIEVRYLTGVASQIAYARAERLVVTPDNDYSFVQALFFHLMGRTGTPGEVSHWVGAVRHRHQRTVAKWRKVAARLEQMPETRRHMVLGWYHEYLGQTPVGKQLNHPTAMLRDHTEEEVLSMILGSRAYFQHAGGNGTAYLQSLVRDLLARPATAKELRHLKALLAATGRQPTAMHLVMSRECRIDTIVAIYQSLYRMGAGQGVGLGAVEVYNRLGRRLDERTLRTRMESVYAFYMEG